MPSMIAFLFIGFLQVYAACLSEQAIVWGQKKNHSDRLEKIGTIRMRFPSQDGKVVVKGKRALSVCSIIFLRPQEGEEFNSINLLAYCVRFLSYLNHLR